MGARPMWDRVVAGGGVSLGITRRGEGGFLTGKSDFLCAGYSLHVWWETPLNSAGPQLLGVHV